MGSIGAKTKCCVTTPEEIELLGELKNLCVKIPILWTIKDVPIYNNILKEKCFKRPRRRKIYVGNHDFH